MWRNGLKLANKKVVYIHTIYDLAIIDGRQEDDDGESIKKV